MEIGPREAAAVARGASRRKAAPEKRPERKGRLGHREQREWEQVEARILEAEARLDACRKGAADPAVATDHMALAERLTALGEAQAAVEHLYARWAELEAKVKD